MGCDAGERAGHSAHIARSTKAAQSTTRRGSAALRSIMSTTRVRLTVGIERMDCDGIIALAQVEIDVHGIVITIRGLEVRRDRSGKVRIDVPRVSHGGESHPVVELPPDLSAAIRREITTLLA
jgi:hypothetical protein